MVAGPLVAQRAVDEDEVGRWADRGDLAGRRDANEQSAAGREKLLRDQHGEWRADGAADDTDLAEAGEIEGKELGVIAGPSFVDASCAHPLEVTDDVAVRVQHADRGDGNERQLPLPARLPQQSFGPEYRRRSMVFATYDRPRDIRAFGLFVHGCTLLARLTQRIRPEGRRPSIRDSHPPAGGRDIPWPSMLRRPRTKARTRARGSRQSPRGLSAVRAGVVPVRQGEC